MLSLRRAFAAFAVVLLGMSGALGASLLDGSRAFSAGPKPTATALTSSGTPSLPGATVVFTATVQRNGGGTADPTSGTVTFYDGAVEIGTGTVGATHQASFATSALAMGTHSITASFAGDASFAPSVSPVFTQVVSLNPTTTTVGSDLNPSQLGQSVTFTATVTSAAGTPIGTVDFADNAVAISECDAEPLVAGVATCVTPALTVGSHAITATYGGAPTFSTSSSVPLMQAVDALVTTTALSADVNPSTFGDVVTFTAVVSATAGTAPTSGTVTFYDGVDVIGSSTVDGSAVATLSIDSLAAGSHDITAVYGGVATHGGSTSSVLTQDVAKADTTTSVTFDVDPSAFGDPVTFTATVTPHPGDGTVQFTIDGADFGPPVPVDAGGEAVSAAVSNLTVGDHAIGATFSGGANHNGSTGLLTQTVNPASTTTALESDANPSVYGDAVTFTATISGAGTPTGTVVFESDGTTIPGCGSETLSAGIATCTTDSLGAGTHTITADYSGSDSYDPSSATPLDQAVAPAATITTVLADVNPSTFGDSVTVTASVTGVPSVEIPTGSVQFTIDGVPVAGPATLAAGSASLVVSDLAAGDHEIDATYSGSENYEGSTASVTQTVDQAATSTVVDADVHPSVYGDAVTFTATVSVASIGTVQFTVDGVDLGSPVAVDSGGEAVSDAISTLGAGDHDVAAAFSGSANYLGSIGTFTQTVFRADTTTNVTSDDNPSTYGETVTFTATILPQPAGGSVQFSLDGAPIGGPVAISGGDASLVGSGLAPGVHQIDADFLGSANYKPSSDSLSQTVVKVPSTTAVTITPTVPTSGAPVTLTATVSGSLTGSGPTGTVQFEVDGAASGSPVPLSGAGIATVNVPAPAAGSHVVTAQYAGDPEYLSSTGTASMSVAAPPAPPAAPPVEKNGYWMVGFDGSVFAFGDVPYKGGTNVGDVADIEPTRSGQGYWVVMHNGSVLRFGDAPNFGDARNRLNPRERVVSMSATPANDGYWLFTDLGRVMQFGAAPFLGDMSAVRLNGPVLGSISTPTGRGYYMVASDGGVFSFGDAAFHGSMGSTRLNSPVMGLVPDHDNHGYWLVARDGGLFAFDAPFRGSMGGTRLNKPVIGMVGFGAGYLMVAEDGGIFNFSDKPFRGSLGSNPHWAPIVSVAAHAEP